MSLIQFALKFCILISVVQCWTNYKIVFQSLRLNYHDPEYLEIKHFEVYRVNRTYRYLYVNVTTKKTVNSVLIEGQLYKQMSNVYNEHFRPLALDFCAAFSGFDNFLVSGMSKQLMSTLLKPLHKAFTGHDQILPKGCPFPPGPMVMKYNADEDELPAFLFPEGKWLANGTLSDGPRVLMHMSMYFDIRMFSSEKQKKKLG